MDLNADAVGFMNDIDDCLLLPDDNFDLCVDFLQPTGQETVHDPDDCPRANSDGELWSDTFRDDVSSNESFHEFIYSSSMATSNEKDESRDELDVFSFCNDIPDDQSQVHQTTTTKSESKCQDSWQKLERDSMQENRQSSAYNLHCGGLVQTSHTVPHGNSQNNVKSTIKLKDKPCGIQVKCRDKTTQRKLRNKESARRYREKQVAKRRQLENYTRTLAAQNRELESLHQRLLTLTYSVHVSA